MGRSSKFRDACSRCLFRAVYTGTRPGLTPAIRAGKGWRGRRELAPRRSATQIRCMHRRRVWTDTYVKHTVRTTTTTTTTNHHPPPPTTTTHKTTTHNNYHAPVCVGISLLGLPRGGGGRGEEDQVDSFLRSSSTPAVADAGLVWLVASRALFPVIVCRPEMLRIMAGMHQKDSCPRRTGNWIIWEMTSLCFRMQRNAWTSV